MQRIQKITTGCFSQKLQPNITGWDLKNMKLTKQESKTQTIQN